ncbi:MAG: amino acid permease [Chitinophagales bacterium]|nr:amino acid permease [Chitinophagales bacterium]
MESTQGTFRREIRLVDGVMLVAGTMIGSGIFIVSADIARNVGSSGYLLLVWALSGFLTIVAALCYGELTSMFPKAGGQYVFLREAYNPMMGFLYGWTYFFVIQTGTIAAVAVAFSKFTGVFIPLFGPGYIVADVGLLKITTQQVLAIIIIALLTFVNIQGVRYGKWIQTFFSATKILALFGLIAIGIFVSNSEAVMQNFSHIWDAKKVVVENNQLIGRVPISGWAVIVAVASAMVGSMFSMDAWNGITFTGDEVVNPKRNIPLSMAIGVGLVSLIYLLMNIVYLTNLPLEGIPGEATRVVFERGIQFATDDRVGVAAADAMAGHTAVLMVAALIMLSTFSCLNGLILTAPRMFYKMAEDRLFFSRMGKLNSHGVPAVATIFASVWASLLCLSGTYGNLLDYVVFAVLLFYIFTIIGIFVLRRKMPDVRREYKTFGYPVLPLIYIVLISMICFILLLYKSNYTVPGLFIVALGVPAYYLFRSSARKE